MQDFLIEVINYVPSYYPFTERDGSIGIADFYAQQPVSNFKKLHDDPVYRNFQATCDVVGVPVGPCNKLLKGTQLECVRKPPPPISPPPICQESNGITLPCRCSCIGSCLYRSNNSSDYIEDWDRQELLELIDSVKFFPEIDNTDENNTSIDNNYNRLISHELAGNAYWIGLPPSCEGIWITLVSCEDSEFLGFYELSSPSFGIANQVQLKGRGQRIKIETDTPGVYKKYQVYYSYEFEYKLEIVPPNEMTFRLADSNIVQNAENDDLPLNIASQEIDTYSRFCYDEFVSFTMRNCIKNNNTEGTLGKIPCVCEEEFDTSFDTSDAVKYVLKKDVPIERLDYGTFSFENEETQYCMNASFDIPSPQSSIDPLSVYQYYDAFSKDVIRWNQSGTWENSDQQQNWYSWERKEPLDAFIWDNQKVKTSCYDCLSDKKRENLRNEVPPCENVMCGRVEINANPNGLKFNAWKDTIETGNASESISASQLLEWSMFSKFGFPTAYVYNPYASEEIKNLWYDEINNRFIDGGAFKAEKSQFTIPCFPKIKCEEGFIRVTNILDIARPCSFKYGGQWTNEDTGEITTTTAGGATHELFVGIDYRPNSGCSETCPECSPAGCCVSKNGSFEIISGPIGLVAYNTISVTEDENYDLQVKEAIKSLDLTFMECYLVNCSSKGLELNYQNCIQNNLAPDNCDGTLEDCCKQYAIEECITQYQNDDNFACNNESITEDDFTRIEEYVWNFKGSALSTCIEDPQLGAPFRCAYEVNPLRPSNLYYTEINEGQCLISTVRGNSSCDDGNEYCEIVTKDKRKSPLYFAGNTQSTHTCPTTFCSKCIEGTISECSCCGISNIASKENRSSQSVFNDCGSCSNNNCCPECCSVCNEFGNDSCGLDSQYIIPNWSSETPCGVPPCEWYYLDWLDCVQNCLPGDLSGNDCENACSYNPNFECNCDELYQIYEDCDVDDEYTDDGTTTSGGFGGPI